MEYNIEDEIIVETEVVVPEIVTATTDIVAPTTVIKETYEQPSVNNMTTSDITAKSATISFDVDANDNNVDSELMIWKKDDNTIVGHHHLYTTNNSFEISNLMSNTDYKWRVKTIADNMLPTVTDFTYFTTDAGYVTDGLVYHWSGANYDGESEVWTDLIKGESVSIGSNLYNQDTKGFIITSTMNHSLSLLPNLYTFEYYFKMYNTVNQKWVATFASSCLTIYSGGNRFHCSISSSPIYTMPSGIEANKNVGISVNPNANYAFKDAVQCGTSGTDYWNNIGQCFGGRTSGTNAFSGELYEVRIYNRLLSEEEILSNYNRDVEIYG